MPGIDAFTVLDKVQRLNREQIMIAEYAHLHPLRQLMQQTVKLARYGIDVDPLAHRGGGHYADVLVGISEGIQPAAEAPHPRILVDKAFQSDIGEASAADFIQMLRRLSARVEIIDKYGVAV